MKYSATILLFAAAVFWSSASARPHNPEQQGFIDAFTRWAFAEIEQLPEPHKTKLVNKLHEAQHQHWDNLLEYMLYVQSMLVRYVRESGIEFSRRKRDVDSNELVGSDDTYNNEIIYAIYARTLILMAPPAHREALEKKYTEALEEDYDNFDDFKAEANNIFEEETKLDSKKIEAAIVAEGGNPSEWKNKFSEDFTNALETALEKEDSSSEED